MTSFCKRIKDAQGNVFGLWVADQNHPNLNEFIEAFDAEIGLPCELITAYREGQYRIVANRSDGNGGAFLMFGSSLAPGEAKLVKEPPRSKARGDVDGWLLIFCLCVTFGSLLTPTYAIYDIWWKPLFSHLSRGGDVEMVWLWIPAGVIALSIYQFIVGCVVWGKNPNGKKIAQTFLIIRPFAVLFIAVGAAVFESGSMSPVVVKIFRSALFGLPFSVVWFWYFAVSERVANRYGSLFELGYRKGKMTFSRANRQYKPSDIEALARFSFSQNKCYDEAHFPEFFRGFAKAYNDISQVA